MAQRPTPLTILPRSFASQVDDAWTRHGGAQLMQRLWEKDAGPWASTPEEATAIRNRLGWLSILPVMESAVEDLTAFAQQIKQAGFTHAVLLGMGGSSLFPEVCRSLFGTAPGWLDLTVLDTTDPTAIAQARQRLPLERTMVIVSSKSGTTIEPHALCQYFYEQLRDIRGTEAGSQCLAITDVGTPLEARAKQLGFRRIFSHGPATGAEVGGRFSALTYFGLVPAALLGVDLRRLLSRARAMLDNTQAAQSLAENSAAQLGLALGEGAAVGRDKVTLLCPPSLASLGLWVEQLVAESTGKSGKGLIPICGEPLRSPEAYGADRVFIAMQRADQPDRPLDHAVQDLAAAGHPVVRLQWEDAYDLGGETMRWFVATVLAAAMMHINPFDEPNVQESKDRTKALLQRYASDHALPMGSPLAVDGGVTAFGARSRFTSRTLPELLRELFQQVDAGEYVALLSFLPRSESLERQLIGLRRCIVEETGVVTMLNHGPRYLHSIGQLYKGGPDRGVLLCVTCDEPDDLSIPGQPYTFGVLKRAQALGDVQALMDRRRRVLHVHLGSQPEAELSKLLEWVEVAVKTARGSGR